MNYLFLLFVFLIHPFLSLRAQERYAEDAGRNYQTGNTYYYAAKNDSALIYLDRAVSAIVPGTDYRLEVKTLLLRSRILGNLTFFGRALQDAIKSLGIAKKHHSNELTASALLAVGKVHYLMYNDSAAESYMLQAKALAEKKHLPKELMQADAALAQLYAVLERNEECVGLAAQSLQMAKQQKDTVQIIENLHLFASYYINLNRWTNPIVKAHQQKAKEYLDEANKLLEQQNIPMLQIANLLNRIRYYRVEKDYPRALQAAQEVIKSCEPSNYSVLIQVYDHLVAIYAHLGEKENVINSHQQFHVLMRKQSDYNLHQSLQEMKAKYQTEETAYELTVRTQQLRNARLIYVLSFIILILLAVVIAHLIYNGKRRKKQNEQLAKLNATKDKLFSIISHDLKAPAVAQSLAINHLVKQADTGADASTQILCRTLQENANEQVSTIENLMNWARVQTDRIHYTPQNFDIVSVISGEIKLYAVAARNKSIRIHTKLPESCVVFADKQMITIVLQNLLNNAVKFTKETGAITISCACSRQEAAITVQNDGVGMSKQQIDALYTTGQQVEVRFGTKGEKGTGLGLVLCKDLLERNNSRLFIDSREQQGTTIRFSLKKAPQNCE